MEDDIPPRNSVEQKDGECRDFVGPMMEPCRYQQSAARVNLPSPHACVPAIVFHLLRRQPFSST